MKKGTLISIILATFGGILLSLGMVMTLVEKFNLFIPGVIVGIIGLVVLAMIYPIYCLVEHKKMFNGKGNSKVVGVSLYGVVSFLLFGAGMSLVLTQNQLGYGIVLGTIGFLMCLGLIPLIMKLKGVKFTFTKAKVIAYVVGTIGFIFLGVGVGLTLSEISNVAIIIGLIVGLIGIATCILTPTVYKYEISK